MIRFDDILDMVASRFSEKDTALLQKAYVFSAKAHKGQVRRSGEPYLSHPLEVCRQLAELGLDRTSLVAGLLHDVLEDTDVTPAELKEAFGKPVADLVEGVTKISRVQDASPEIRRAETIRKIILAMTDDIRVIFIKLADRLHNLQTLRFLAPEAQKRIAAETLEIYAPIANRLGMGRIKAELEDLAFRYVEPEEYLKIAALVEPRRKKAEADLAAFREKLEGMMKANGIPVEIQARIKRPYSISRKMTGQKIEFNQVYDFLALRIITDSVKSCYAALGIIHQEWPPIPQRFRDFIAMPKPNLYQALHTTVITEGKVSFEIQIRTRDMHALAENGIAAHWKYKDVDPQSLVREDRRLQWLREMVELFEEQKNPKEFLKHLKINLIPEEVYVFTPKGQVVSLPTGASALDFAFRIHSAIGLHSASARINGKTAPLKTVLKPGDIVEIITQPERGPSRSWLAAAFTAGARQQIKRALHQQEKSKSVVLGRKLWDKGLRRHVIGDGGLSDADLTARLRRATGLRLDGPDDFYAQAGLGRVMINRRLMEKIFPGAIRGGRVPDLNTGRGGAGGPVIRVKDRDVQLIRLARCCRPIKGEPIVGYMTAGKGVTVHARRCPRIAREVLAPERWVDVTWEGVALDSFRAKLVVRSADKPGILAALTAVIAGRQGDIAKAEVETYPDGRAEVRFNLKVRDIRNLDDIVTDLKALEGIDSVERV